MKKLYLSKRDLDLYADSTEPDLYPDLYESLVLKKHHDKRIGELFNFIISCLMDSRMPQEMKDRFSIKLSELLKNFSDEELKSLDMLEVFTKNIMSSLEFKSTRSTKPSVEEFMNVGSSLFSEFINLGKRNG